MQGGPNHPAGLCHVDMNQCKTLLFDTQNNSVKLFSTLESTSHEYFCECYDSLVKTSKRKVFMSLNNILIILGPVYKVA